MRDRNVLVPGEQTGDWRDFRNGATVGTIKNRAETSNSL